MLDCIHCFEPIVLLDGQWHLMCNSVKWQADTDLFVFNGMNRRKWLIRNVSVTFSGCV